MMNVIVVDDEPKNVRIMKELLTFCGDVAQVGEAANISEAEKVIKLTKPDLVLLDIEMPHGNAFDLLDRIMPVDFEIIFVTAFDEYAVKAFKYSALDYLLKPVSINELQNAIERAREKLAYKTMNARLGSFIENTPGGSYNLHRIALPASQKGHEFILVNEIMFCEAKGGYTYVVTDKRQSFVTSKTLKEFEDILPEDIFLRVHYSYLVNLKKVKKYSGGRGGFLQMENGAEISVATRRRDELLLKLGLK